jgi:hypothetical protein
MNIFESLELDGTNLLSLKIKIKKRIEFGLRYPIECAGTSLVFV